MNTGLCRQTLYAVATCDKCDKRCGADGTQTRASAPACPRSSTAQTSNTAEHSTAPRKVKRIDDLQDPADDKSVDTFLRALRFQQSYRKTTRRIIRRASTSWTTYVTSERPGGLCRLRRLHRRHGRTCLESAKADTLEDHLLRTRCKQHQEALKTRSEDTRRSIAHPGGRVERERSCLQRGLHFASRIADTDLHGHCVLTDVVAIDETEVCRA